MNTNLNFPKNHVPTEIRTFLKKENLKNKSKFNLMNPLKVIANELFPFTRSILATLKMNQQHENLFFLL